jgi:hypothetical protein
MRNLLKKLSKITADNQKNAGMSIVEMILAGLFTAVVLGGASTGIASIMKTQAEVANQIDRRLEVNRALDFMGEESSKARVIEIVGDGAGDTVTLADVAPTFVTKVLNYDYTVLLLQLPDVSERIIYYLDSPPTNSVWRGPKVVYRWGPKLDADGNYVVPNTPANWTSEPLIDLIDGTASSPNCPTGWFLSPNNDITPTGFFACINLEAKAASFSLNGKMNKVTGNAAIYKGDKTTIAMATHPPEIADTPPPLVSKPVVSVTNCDVINGVIQCDSPALINFTVLGDVFSCSGWGKVFTAFTVNGQDVKKNNRTWFRANDPSYDSFVDLTVTSITEIVVKSKRDSGCGTKIRTSNNPQDLPFIKVLVDNDPVPAVPGWNGQASVETFLRPYVENNGAGDKMKLAPNQGILLFEMWTDLKGATNDLQDNVVLMSVTALDGTDVCIASGCNSNSSGSGGGGDD